MKKSLFFFFLAFSIITISWLILGAKPSPDLKYEDTNLIQITDSVVLTDDSKTPDSANNRELRQASKNVTAAQLDRVKKLNYSDQWCFTGQLKEKDVHYADTEIADWEESVGRFTFSLQTDSGLKAYGNGYVFAPYLEIPKPALQDYIDDDDVYAMFAALDRSDFSLQHRNDIAKRLLIFGYTGKAISYLISNEYSQAVGLYSSNNGVLSNRIREYLINILVYSSYSLRKYDAIGFLSFLYLTPIEKEDLNPATVLSEDEISQVRRKVVELEKSITLARAELHLPPINRELTRVAQHNIDADIGTIKAVAPITVTLLEEKLGDLITDFTETNECNEEHRKLFARIR